MRPTTLGWAAALVVLCGGDALAQDVLSVEELRSTLEARDGEIASLRDALGSRSDALEEVRGELEEASSGAQQASQLQSELDSANSRLNAAAQAFSLYEFEISNLKADSQANAEVGAALLSKVEQGLRDNEVEEAAVTLRDDGVVVALASESLFNSGSGELNATGQALIGRVADAVAGLSNDIAVEGHTDNKGVGVNIERPFTNNWELSAARAASAVNFMQSNAGIDPGRLSARGFGEHRPVASNETAAGRSANRRVEVVLLP